jgi:hypothetical protein
MPQLTRERALLAARGLALARVAIGATAWISPKVVLRPWVGSSDAGFPSVILLGRALGARDIALGAGALLAARDSGPVRGWVEAGGLADAGDTLATVLAFGDLPRMGRWAILATTLGAVVAAAVISPALGTVAADARAGAD